MDPVTSQNLLGLVAIAGGITIAMTVVLCKTIAYLHCVSRMTALKLRLLEHGMNSHEIERVCSAGLPLQYTQPSQRSSDGKSHLQKPASAY